MLSRCPQQFYLSSGLMPSREDPCTVATWSPGPDCSPERLFPGLPSGNHLACGRCLAPCRDEAQGCREGVPWGSWTPACHEDPGALLGHHYVISSSVPAENVVLIQRV